MGENGSVENNGCSNNSTKKLCVIWCEDTEKWDYGFNVFHDLFFPSYEHHLFKIAKGDDQLPELSSLSNYSAIIITGSRYSVYSDKPWIKDLLKWLQDYRSLVTSNNNNNNNLPKVAGICFGHQAIGHALGGFTSKNDKYPKKNLVQKKYFCSHNLWKNLTSKKRGIKLWGAKKRCRNLLSCISHTEMPF